MFRTLTSAAILAAAFAVPGFAETVEVQMLNRGDAGNMVFEPAFVRIAPGDTVTFIAADRGHNAESVDGMMPEGAEPFAGRINQEISVTLTEAGLYGVQCKPHFAMGMVMTIAVGDITEMPAGHLEGRLPRKARERFEEQLQGL